MLRILAFFLVVLAVSLGFGWLADNPGSVSFTWQNQTVDISMMIFLIALAVLIFCVLVVVWLIAAFFRAPHSVGNWWQARRRDKGYSALSSGIIAAGAGDAILARRMTKRSDKLLNSRREPLIRFLDAQTAMIEGDHARARSVFEEMERDPETRLLAMRGLYLEAERVGDEAAQRYYAERAVRIAPHVPWAGGAVLETKSLAHDWDGAMQVLEAQKNTRLIDRDESRRTRAVLLTAKAMETVEADPKTARSAGLEAHQLAPELAPAALVASQALLRLGDLRKATKVLEKSWTYGPHPEVAEAYVTARAGDSVDDRLKRARHLHDLRPGHVESSLCLARAALDANDLALARKSALEAAEIEPRESVYLLLADIEEEDTGEVGRVREWLSKAIRAPRDPAWVADGVVSNEWAPVSPVTGRLDAFEWKAPMQRAQTDTPVLEASDGEEDMKTIEPVAEAKPEEATTASTGTAASKPTAERPTDAPVKAAQPAPASTNGEAKVIGKFDPKPERTSKTGGEDVARNGAETAPASQAPEQRPAAKPTHEERKEARFG